MQTLEQLIGASPLFARLAPEQLAVISGCAVNQHFPAGAQMFREGDPAERFYLIRSGAIALELQAPGQGTLVIETLHDGEVVGWSWLFEPYRWQFDGRARPAPGPELLGRSPALPAPRPARCAAGQRSARGLR